MQKIYGYKQEDLIAIAKSLTLMKTKNLPLLFNEFSVKSGKSVGTVKNLYYALVKLSQTDQDFCDRYLGGTPLSAEKSQPFTKAQEEWLLLEIVKGVKEGKSVRAIVYSLANGDGKLALRYQNKYRSILVKNPDLAREMQKAGSFRRNNVADIKVKTPQALIQRLKKEIDGLAEKIAIKEKKENATLRQRVAFLEKENLTLTKLLHGETIESRSIKYFTSPSGTSVVH